MKVAIFLKLINLQDSYQLEDFELTNPKMTVVQNDVLWHLQYILIIRANIASITLLPKQKLVTENPWHLKNKI